ncbi:uncharacterized protein [Rutidosis leptorrhynchoides]|uniref:uncharacterized protein n=1 Tax=Rutidosis leptorrhynchoides TaxID=125765 RepID=UPI003A9A5B6C
MWDAEDDVQGLAQCAFHMLEDEDEDEDDIQQTENHHTVPNINAERLFHSKCVGKCNEKGLNMILDTMREAFPHACIPKSFYEVRKTIRELGLGYEKIDAYPNDCILYWKHNKDKIKCDVCQTSRYKQSNNDSDESTKQADHNDGDYKGKKVRENALCYFPLILHFQRLFMYPKTVESMRWHEESHMKDGLLRHPAYSPAWKTFNYQNHEFAKEPRNVRVGLENDGFNPVGNMSISHSTWPVVLMSYNLPPWLCMKKPFLFLTLLLSGPSAPASTKSNFQLRAGLIWTLIFLGAFRQLCLKVLNPTDLVKMEKDIGNILCELERIFTPSFFDVMIHLSVHIASEAGLGDLFITVGCIQSRASDVETIYNKTSRNHDGGGDETVLPILCMSGRPIGATNVERLGYDTLAIAHSYVLVNCSEIYFLRIDHLNIPTHGNQHKRKRDIQYVEKNRTIQNSGVMLEAITSRFSSARDNNPVTGHVTYYGVLNDIIKLLYADDKKVVLFHCDSISGSSRIKFDENGFTIIHFRGLKQTKEPYILASQAQQVFYAKDHVRKGWKVVIKTTPRDNFDMNEQMCIDDVETHLQSDTPLGPELVENATIELVAATNKYQIGDASR